MRKRTVEVSDGDRVVRKESMDYLRDRVYINDKEEFIKFYTGVIEDLVESNLSGSDFKVVMVCLKNLNYFSGSITYPNGNYLSPKDIVRESGLTERTVLRGISALVEAKILHKGRVGNEYQLHANPFVFMKGAYINKTLYDMFKKTKWAKEYIKMGGNFEVSRYKN